MIQLYSNGIAVASTVAIPLENVVIKKGCSTVNSGTRTIQLNKEGVYLVSVNATGVSTTATTGDITIQLMKNGVLIPSAIASETVANTTATHALGFSALVTVPQNNSCKCSVMPTVISVMNEGVATTFNNINVVVTKIC